jgi:hypothetical protein
MSNLAPHDPDQVEAAPPIVFIDEDGGVGPMFRSIDVLIEYLEWPEQFDGDSRDAYDRSGRRITLTLDSERTSIAVTVSPDAHPEELEALLRPIARDRPMRFGLLDADVDLDTLLRALWPHMKWGRGTFPGDIPGR